MKNKQYIFQIMVRFYNQRPCVEAIMFFIDIRPICVRNFILEMYNGLVNG